MSEWNSVIEIGRFVGVGNKAAAAPGFVHSTRSHGNALARFEYALGIVGGLAAADANGVGFRDVFGNGKELRHGLKRPAGVILVQSRDNNPDSAARKFICNRHQLVVKELPLVDSDDLRIWLKLLKDLDGGFYGPGFMAHLGMGHDVITRISDIDSRLKDLHLLTGDLGPSQPADQFFGLAGKHRAGYHLNPARGSLQIIYSVLATQRGKFFHLL
jgi:hypothetical protein